MEINWRFPAATAAAAFVIVVLTAAISGVGFGALLFRAFFGSIVFAILGAGGELFVRKFLPELVVESTAVDEAGSSVDITIDEENPHERDDQPNPHEREEGERVAQSPDVMGEGDAINDGDVEEFSTVDEPENEVSAEGGSSDGQEVADTLPSFDRVETSFETSVESRTDQPEGSASRSATVDVMGLEEDPTVMAKAVRTLMKRDEQG